MKVIIKDDNGNVVVEKEVQDVTCTIKVTENDNGEKHYEIEPNAYNYH